MASDLTGLIPARGGHFLLESGHHGEFWLDLEPLCRWPEGVMALAKELAGRLAPLEPAVVCGPLVEEAFVSLLVATELGVDFMCTERLEHSQLDEDFLRSECHWVSRLEIGI